MLDELEVVVLTRDIPDLGLIEGDLGTVVHVHDGAGAYDVEFLGLDGATLAVATLLADAVRPIRAREIAHARPVA